MLSIKAILGSYLKSVRSFSEMVPWMGLNASDMVFNVDGSLMVVYEVAGIDAEGRLPIETDGYVENFERALKVFDEHILVWSIMDRRRTEHYPDADFPTPIGKYLDLTWKQHLFGQRQYENRHYFAVIYRNLGGTSGFFDKLSNHMDRYKVGLLPALWKLGTAATSARKNASFAFEQFDSHENHFRQILEEFETTVGSLGFKKLQNSELLTFMHRRVSPPNDHHRVAMPDTPIYLNTYLPDSTLRRKKKHLEFEGDVVRYVGAMSVKNWPNVIGPGVTDPLLQIDGEITVSQCFEIWPKEKAQKYIQDTQDHFMASSKPWMSLMIEQMTKTESDKVDAGKLALADDAASALEDLTARERQFGHYNMTILSYGDTEKEMEETLSAVGSAMRTLVGAKVVRERMYALSAFTATLPGQWANIVRWGFVNVGNLADLAQLRAIRTGDRRNTHLSAQLQRPIPALALLPTEHNVPFNYNFHQGDLPHFFVVGPSRSGKTTLLNFLISQFFKYHPCNVLIFDKDYSCYVTSGLQGAKHIDMNPSTGKPPRMNPLRVVKDLTKRGWLMRWLQLIVTLRSYEWKTEDELTFNKALNMLADQPPEHWRLSELADFVRPLSSELYKEMLPWLEDGGTYPHFDSVEDDFRLSDFTDVEMGGLLEDEILAPVFIDYAFFCIDEMLTLDRTAAIKPTLIYLEEVWYLLKNKKLRERFDNWLRTLAKKNAIVGMTTQSLAEIADSDIFTTIIDNIQNRIFLPNPSVMAHLDLYRDKFQLNSEQIERIRTAKRKVQYYFVNPEGMSRMVNVKFPPEMLACLRSDQLAKKKYEEFKAKLVPDWQEQFIEELVRIGEAAESE
ncbi:VirB4 family type IV secretion system protein [Ralstonia pickettii]|uniref:Type IV secretion system protein VirB4 n=1 Tax=Ralstonia pickettii TaxID=329 RepID=A0AAW4Q619_RALPI|nr:type IV secretion system protein VirB4 [Ralstonia pickettii]MBA9846715.1 type IV secretion system protein VirB4 [Ralstonia pickettii]MBA9852133.1 type IV secretion system protein VirB4 [Ralstonia pickettii]MBA9919853.1 type IV secretion system protein VirB4 [Ralstonia pickettii]MBA9958955.1 type IV secretion system protein VirB4 [Ralstonia pickettii]MBA9964667.1 type IV secretion system protein VirB4 [Ralstonia pickettii]